jgi:predicted NBD/HSP70 family sugar kinase
MGLVIDDALIHGARGAAGEIAYLPIGWDVFGNPEVRLRGALEEAAASSAIEDVFNQRLDEGMSSTLRPGARVADIFAAATDGDAAAIAVIDHEARLVSQAILAVSAVVDPQLFLLGGGIGSNPLLLEPVRRYVDEIAPYEIQIETSALGDRASVLGALAVGLHHVREKLFSERGVKYG